MSHHQDIALEGASQQDVVPRVGLKVATFCHILTSANCYRPGYLKSPEQYAQRCRGVLHRRTETLSLPATCSKVDFVHAPRYPWQQCVSDRAQSEL